MIKDTIKQMMKKALFKKSKGVERYPDDSKILRGYNRCLTFLIGYPTYIKNIFNFGVLRFLFGHPYKRTINRNLYIVAIIKNEGKYLEEWLVYHSLIGVKGFIIYDNGSSDTTRDIINKYKDKFNIDYNFFPGKSMQMPAYRDAVERYKEENIWLLTIDADEFIVPVTVGSITEWLNSISDNVGQVLIGWMIFGSSGHVKSPDGLVLDNYRAHATNKHITNYKPIVKPDYVVSANMPHMYNVIGKTIDENGARQWFYPYPGLVGSRPASKNKVRINHYYTKSLEDYDIKTKRGDANNAGKNLKSMNEFKVQDRNEEQDKLLDRYINELKRLLN